MTTAAGPSKAALYTTHLRNDLFPAIQAAREGIARLEWDISEYKDVISRLANVRLRSTTEPEETLTELGGGIWVDARIQDTSSVTLDIGLDIHMELSVQDAIAYSTKRISVLEKKKDVLTKRMEGLEWQVEQFNGAIAQADNGVHESVR
ncbi:Prefoldin subunit-domain-containing protein [Naematelia encephala]|uniref:Prefoldin subunit-domain-containing protein n=1 Tax=Naematelia encephala TaxID=71784 RepID=A0A1Y2BBH0_9TREE|nr:Prefoldin subunit-domain-containing protein [Naematelia encephala]